MRGLQHWLSPWADRLVDIGTPLGARVTSVRRSRELQARLYRRFVRGQARYPVAPPGHSLHERGLAFDLTAPPSVLQTLGSLWESWGGRWGGRYGDPIHFEARL